MSGLVSFFKKMMFALWLRIHGLTLKEIDSLAREFGSSLRSFAFAPVEQPIFLGMIGGYGVGKTTVARKIAEQLSFVVLCTDELRRFLERKGCSLKAIDNNQLIFMIGRMVAEDLIRQRMNIILDADLLEPRYRSAVQEFLGGTGYTLLFIQVTAEDSVTRDRILQRAQIEKSSFLKLNMSRHFQERANIHTRFPLPKKIYFHLHNDDTIGTRLQSLIEKLKEEYGERFESKQV